jgi:D-lactate dehydrogenase
MSILFFDVGDWEKDRLPKEIGGLPIVMEFGRVSSKISEDPKKVKVMSIFAWSEVDKEVLDRFPNLEHIATRSTGSDHIDMNMCRERGVTVSHVPGYGERTVAEHTWALMLVLSRKILHCNDRTKQGIFSREGLRGFDLEGKTLGIVGCGKIGAKVAEIARSFAMKVIVFDPNHDEKLAQEMDFSYVDSLADLLGQSDVISLHAPLTKETKHMINMETVDLIKPGALLINTARGDLVQTAALLKALDEGRIAGAGLDVLERERLIHEEAEVLSKGSSSNQELSTILGNHILLNNPNVIITPHNAFNSEEAVEKILDTTVENIEAYLKGNMINLVE